MPSFVSFLPNPADLSGYQVGAVIVIGICLNKAVLHTYIGLRKRKMGMTAVAVSLYLASFTVLLLAGFIATYVFRLLPIPAWSWQPVLGVHLLSVGYAEYQMHIRLWLPLTAGVKKLTDERGHGGSR